MNHQVLFICTGNFYRSRFAEAIFNYHAEQREIPWTALSRGLAVHLAQGDISPLTAEALAVRQIGQRHTGPTRKQLSETDLSSATHSIALYWSEHFPMMTTQFPRWAERIDYGEIPDVPFRSPNDALRESEHTVIRVLERVSR